MIVYFHSGVLPSGILLQFIEKKINTYKNIDESDIVLDYKNHIWNDIYYIIHLHDAKKKQHKHLNIYVC